MNTDGIVLWNVVEEHLAEAKFLLGLWLRAARSPRFSMTQIQKTMEPRLIAHLDGLAVGGPAVANELLWQTLDKCAKAPALRVAGAALALLLDSDASTLDRLLELFRTAETIPLRKGLSLAFQVTPRDDVNEPLRVALYATEGDATRSAILAVLAARRVDPGPILSALLAMKDPDVLRGALAAAQAADRTRFRNLVEDHLSHDVPSVRAAALRTALIWNLDAGWRICPAEARAGSPEAMLFLALLGGPRGLPPLLDALRSDADRKAALFALGFTGRREAVEACLPFLDHPDARVTKLAVEAISGITGLSLYDEPFALPAEDDGDGDLPPLAEDLKIDLDPVPIDELPRPNATEVRKWWSERRSSLSGDQRYLRGLLLSAASAQIALSNGPLRRTGPLTCEVAVRSGGRVQLPAFRLAHPKAAVPADVALSRPPAWS